MASRPRLLSQQPLNVQRATLQWARIGSVAGAASDTTYTDATGVTWRVVQWTANATSGLVLAVPGMVDALVVGGGTGGTSNTLYYNGAGCAVAGYQWMPVGAHNIAIGAGGSGGTTSVGAGANAGTTSLGPIQARAGVDSGTPVTSSITGQSLTYAQTGVASPRAGFGDGGLYTNNGGGSSGRVIIRVPA